VGGLRLTVRDSETGYLVDRRDPQAFAAALSRVLSDPSARERLGANAVKLAQRFPWARTADGILDAFASVTACPDVRRALVGAR
jgi:D-inositol-3-phosphate glycosyltransferase